ncbi:MAG: NAD(P)(+) transhydrogenase (Re/Si-specific) subunit beta [Bacteroidales bacterium]|nr:NAD(P)(+) transhydrogenase (Re/Si-specific) subunit beta [Bacteroidales bacterium]
MMETILTTADGVNFTTGEAILELSYLLAAILFVIGLKLLSHPETARKGNLWAGSGMVLAMITTLLLHKDAAGNHISLTNAVVVLAAIAAAGIVGWIIARRIKMTAMPQLVSFFNATGGAASALVAFLEFPNVTGTGVIIITLLGLTIGSISFSGSLVAYGKLDGKIGDIRASFMKYLNIALLLIVIVLIVLISSGNTGMQNPALAVSLLLAVALVYGVLFVMPIGGADMPVVISLLNSLTGIAAAMAGFIYSNQAMILGGILVGAAGSILTLLMCRAMNRSLVNVIIGAFGGGGAAAEHEGGTIKEISVSDASILMAYSQRIVIVPGYGLAVAQAQHIAAELDELLSEKGVEVKFAIHPVAGRMPGHMNVLLAEADVSYDKLVEMDEINPALPNTDVVIVVGANDVVNPAAEDDPSSPIYGMPIIKAYTAKNIIVMKRGMGKGYAGIENYLFFNDKTRMLFGNAKDSIQKLVTEIKSL